MNVSVRCASMYTCTCQKWGELLVWAILWGNCSIHSFQLNRTKAIEMIQQTFCSANFSTKISSISFNTSAISLLAYLIVDLKYINVLGIFWDDILGRALTTLSGRNKSSGSASFVHLRFPAYLGGLPLKDWSVDLS